jgi:PAS domain S-box-containing protein
VSPESKELATFRISAEGRYVDGDDAALRLLGVTLEELRGKWVGDFTTPEQRDVIRANWHTVVKSPGAPVVRAATVIRPDGSTVLAHMLTPQVAPDGTFVVRGYAVDHEGTAQTETLAVILDRWRSAERACLTSEPGSSSRREAELEAESLRLLYRFAERLRMENAPG